MRASGDLPEPVRERLDELFSRDALEDALEGVDPERITGPGGLIADLAGRVIEAALAAELTGHLGHPPGGRPTGSHVRNGSTPKTLSTDLGAVEIRTPRDRDGSFEPQLVANCQTRLAGLDERILFPQTWTQTCIVHEIRASMRFASYKDRKQVASALRPIYPAPSAEHALAELDAFEQA